MEATKVNTKVNNKDKYLLLSCPEFNDTVDNMLSLDNKTDCGKNNTQNPDKELYKNFIESTGLNLNNTSLNKFKRKISKCESAHFYRGFINWKSYKDGTPDIKMDSETVKRLKDRRVIFLAYFTFNETSVTTILDQIIFLNSLSHYGVAEINIVLPYFPVGTMERIVGEGEIPTAYSLAHMLNSIPEGTAKNKIYIFDIHALCSRFFFHTNTVPILITMMPLYLEYIQREYKNGNGNGNGNVNVNVIVFPDDGAKKRFGKVLPKDFLKITCSKERIGNGNTRKIKIDEGLESLLTKKNQNNKTKKISRETHKLKNGNINLFIIDDLVQSGGTLKETVKGIQNFLSDFDDFNSKKIHFFPIVTHAVFPGNKNDSFFEFTKKNANGHDIKNEDIKIEKLITTDSRPTKIAEMKKKDIKDKVEVIKIAEPLFEIFTRSEKSNRFVTPYSIK